MKPRTKYQKQVVTSNKGLRPIKGAQMQWAFRECLDHYAFQLKHGQTTCNHQLSQAGLTIGNERIVR